MNENRFATAGWMSIVLAVLFPVALILEGIQDAVSEIEGLDISVGIGLGDLLFLVYAVLTIYVLMKLKEYLYENYSFKNLNTVINVCILWTMIFFGGGFVLELLYSTVWPQNDLGLPLLLLVFYIVGIAVFGILDIVIGITLLHHRSRFRGVVKLFGALCLINGFFEGTVVLSFMTLLMIPASYVVLGIMFFSRTEEVEFV